MKKKPFKINPTYLKHLREKHKLSQEALAVVALSDGDISTVPENKRKSLLRMYQKIERDGKTSFERATRIANELGVTADNLTGLSKPEVLRAQKNKLVEHIKSCIAEMTASNDEIRLTRLAEMLKIEPSQILSIADSFSETVTENTLEKSDNSNFSTQIEEFKPSCESFVKKLLEKAEWLNLFDDMNELQSVAELLNISIDDLKPCAAMESYWWLSFQNTPVYLTAHSRYGEQLSYTPSIHPLGELIKFNHRLDARINTVFEASTNYFPKRLNQITLTVKNHKYHLTFEKLGLEHEKWSCQFRACDVSSENGVQWIKASDWEHERLMSSLKHFISDYADVAVIDGTQYPPQDKPRTYRVSFFQVQSYHEYDPELPKTWINLGTRIFDHEWLFCASFRRMFDEHKEEDWKDGFDNFPVRLFAEVDKSSFNSWVNFELLESYPLRYDKKAKRPIKRYVIERGWLDEEGQFHSAPWSKSKRENFIKHKWIEEDFTRPPDYDYEVPPFEPDTQDLQSVGDEQ